MEEVVPVAPPYRRTTQDNHSPNLSNSGGQILLNF
jgi:hypothetical protein